MCPEAGSEGWLRCLAHPLGGVDCRGMCGTLLLLLTLCFCFRLLKMAAFLVSLYLWSRICLNCSCTQLSLSPCSFFVVYTSRRGMSRCKRCSTTAKGPRSQPVSSPMRDCTPLFFRGKGLQVSSETSSFCTGASETSLAYPRGIEVPHWLFQELVGTWATFHWNGLNSMSYHEPDFKCWILKHTNITQRLNKQRLKENDSH